LKSEHALVSVTSISIIDFLIILFFVNKVNFNLELAVFIYIYIVSLCSTFALWYIAKGLRHLEISTAIPLLSFGPAIVAIISWIFLKESLTNKSIFGILLIVAGSYILETDHKISDLSEPFKKIMRSRYIHYIFSALFLFAIAVTLDRYILSNQSININITTYLFFILLFNMLNFLILINVFYKGFPSIMESFRSNFKWFFLTSALGIVATVFFYKAVSIQLISMVYPILKANSLFSTIIGGGLFHEHKLFLKSIALIVMLIGGYLVIG